MLYLEALVYLVWQSINFFILLTGKCGVTISKTLGFVLFEEFSFTLGKKLEREVPEELCTTEE